MTTPACPFGPELMQEVKDVLGTLARSGVKVDDVLFLPHHSGCVKVEEEKAPLRNHQKVKPS